MGPVSSKPCAQADEAIRFSCTKPPLAAKFLVAVPSWLMTTAQFGALGFEHILPLGLDHILFVLSLFLLAQRWQPLVGQVTAFTLAHSVTLAFATSISSRSRPSSSSP